MQALVVFGDVILLCPLDLYVTFPEFSTLFLEVLRTKCAACFFAWSPSEEMSTICEQTEENYDST